MPLEQPRNRPRKPYRRSGFYTAKRALVKYGSRVLPGPETPIGRELRDWRDSLVADLGGPEAISTQQLALVEKAVTQKLICDSLDGYVLALPSLVNKTKRCAFTILRDRATQVTLLRDLLRDLGLERRSRDVSLVEQIAQLHRERAEGETPPGDEGPG